MNLLNLNHLILIAIVLVAAIIDLRTTKIPNKLTFPAAVLGIILNYLSSSWGGTLNAIGGWLVGAILMVILAVAPIGGKGSKIGMGDAKLIAAIGAFLGLPDIIFIVFYFCFCYGILSLISIFLTLPWKQILERLQVSLISSDKNLPPLDLSKFEKQKKLPIPLGIAIFFATILMILFRHQTLSFFGAS